MILTLTTSQAVKHPLYNANYLNLEILVEESLGHQLQHYNGCSEGVILQEITSDVPFRSSFRFRYLGSLCIFAYSWADACSSSITYHGLLIGIWISIDLVVAFSDDDFLDEFVARLLCWSQISVAPSDSKMEAASFPAFPIFTSPFGAWLVGPTRNKHLHLWSDSDDLLQTRLVNMPPSNRSSKSIH